MHFGGVTEASGRLRPPMVMLYSGRALPPASYIRNCWNGRRTNRPLRFITGEGRLKMTGEGKPAITDADIRSLAAKLKGLHALLTPEEQAVLRSVLRRAAAREDAELADTAGFTLGVSFNPFMYLDAIEFDPPRG